MAIQEGLIEELKEYLVNRDGVLYGKLDEIQRELEEKRIDWKENLKVDIQHKLTSQTMKTFDDVAELFKTRFELLVEGFENEDDIEVELSDRYAKFTLFKKYGIVLAQEFETSAIRISALDNGDADLLHHVQNNNQLRNYKIHEGIVDDLFRVAFYGLSKEDYGYGF